MARLLYALLAFSITIVVSAQPPTVAMGCDVTRVCGGPLRVAASVVIGPKEINGKMIDFFACECLNGTRTAVSKDGTIIIPLDNAPAAAPVPAPAPAAAPAAGPAASAAFDAVAYVADLKSTYPTLCARANATMLSDPLANPNGCRRPVAIGQVCWSSCRMTLRGLGQSCYSVAIAKGAADPTTVGSNVTVAYSQCSKGLAYTTIAEWDPNATAAPLPGASPTPAAAPGSEDASSPAMEPPTTDGGSGATPATPASASWKPSPLFAAASLVASMLI